MDFFFQAEDGIRDGHVTGVQTCALPISHGVHALLHQVGRKELRERRGDRLHRSEERRVGKECRSRRPPYEYKKNVIKTAASTIEGQLTCGEPVLATIQRPESASLLPSAD